jgi:hypothetical protein
MCDLYGEETATLWNVSHPKARVEHRCHCCDGTIKAGEHYALTSSLYDGHWTTEKACAECATVINAFGEEHRFFPSASTATEYLSECDRYGDSEWALPLARILAKQAEAVAKLEAQAGGRS